MELWIETIGNEETVTELLSGAGFAVRMDPDVINVFHMDDGIDLVRVGEVLDAAQIGYQWMPPVEEPEEDDDEAVDR